MKSKPLNVVNLSWRYSTIHEWSGELFGSAERISCSVRSEIIMKIFFFFLIFFFLFHTNGVAILAQTVSNVTTFATWLSNDTTILGHATKMHILASTKAARAATNLPITPSGSVPGTEEVTNSLWVSTNNKTRYSQFRVFFGQESGNGFVNFQKHIFKKILKTQPKTVWCSSPMTCV